MSMKGCAQGRISFRAEIRIMSLSGRHCHYYGLWAVYGNSKQFLKKKEGEDIGKQKVLYFCSVKMKLDMKWLQLLCLLFVAADVFAVPARSRVFRAKMADGTYQDIRFCGDERRSFYLDMDGCVVEKNAEGLFVSTGTKPSSLFPKTRSARYSGIGSPENAPIKSVGSPKIPVILVNFADVKMTVADTDEAIREYYDLYCNGTRDGNLYTGAGSRGAVRDYFAQQSDSMFLPEFEVVGPVTLSRPMAYYGENSGSTLDVHFMDFCREALELAMATGVDFAERFDNDQNGTVDLAFFIYAGFPESDKGVDEDAIWPKEWLNPTEINGVTVSVVACGSEMTVASGGMPTGIGTMCHELSHSLGLPDTYDTQYYTALGMSYWSLMDSGSYVDNGKVPCGYTAYERDFLQWRPLQTLERSTTVRLRPLEAGGAGYKILNEENPDEYYVVENRQAVGWDSSLGRIGHGMLVTHVDYDQNVWAGNRLNVDEDHQRMTFFPANNLYVGQYNASSSAELAHALSGQLYPGVSGNESLTDTSVPSSVVFAGGFMGKPIKQIREVENGDIVFKFMPKGRLEAPESVEVANIAEDGFSLTWSESGKAACYKVEVYGLDAAGGLEASPLSVVDSVYATSCRIAFSGEMADDGDYVCRVLAMHDEYEDSPYSDTCRVDLSATAISPVKSDNVPMVEVYSLNGVLQATSLDAVKSLPKGVYVLRKGRETKKIVVD